MNDSYEIKDFQQDVIEQSHQIPVLVDFWAAWCQPCKMLAPVLKEVAEENKDRFRLAKVDTDKNQETAVKYGIRSIPSVKLFVEGKVEAEFQGALPKKMVMDFINKHIPSNDKKELEEIKNEIKYGVRPEHIARLQKLSSGSQLIEAKVLLSQLCVLDKPEQAKALVDNIFEDSPFFLQANAVKTYAAFKALNENDFEEGTLRMQMIRAKEYLLHKDFDNGLNLLIECLMLNKTYMNELARKVCIAVFTILGNDHEISRKYRKRFDRSLY